MKKKTNPERSPTIGAPGRQRSRPQSNRKHMLKVYVSDEERAVLNRACDKLNIPRSEFMAEVSVSEAKLINSGAKVTRKREWNRVE